MQPLSADNVTVKTRSRVRNGVDDMMEIFVDDQATDSLVIFKVFRTGPVGAPDKLTVIARVRGNLSARERPQTVLQGGLHAPEVSTAKVNDLRRKAGLAPVPDQKITVAVAFNVDFDTPAEAAAYGEEWSARTFAYEARASLKLNIGDRVLCPVGDRQQDRENRVGTVVALNAECPVDYIKEVIGLA